MALTKDDFLQAAVNEIADYPDLALRYQIGDPLIQQQMNSQAAMLALLSDQVDTTAAEPFTKARDVTVEADAAVKGILPWATPSIASIKITNGAASAQSVIGGRTLLDQQGRYWQILTGATIAASSIGYVTAQQVKLRSLSSTVTVNQPFYTIALAQPDVGYIASVVVTNYTWSVDFANTLAGDLVYNIKSDDTANLSVQFGITGLAGVQPPVGEVVAITILDTEGDLTLSQGMKYSFEYAATTLESQLVLELDVVTQAGADPMDITTKREICSYPGIYSNSAVFLSEFDYVVRKGITPVQFLSIWNEAEEEAVRGASLDNINTLFIAVRKTTTVTATLQAQVSAIIDLADDSYKHKYVDVVDVVVPFEMSLTIPSIYDSAAVVQSVTSLMITNYGVDSAWSKRGNAKILEKDVYDLLRQNVTALTERKSNIVVTKNGSGTATLPEDFQYVTADSLVITPVEAT